MYSAKTRMPFRVLAGLLGLVLLFLSFPLAMQFVSEDWVTGIFCSVCSLFGGIGLLNAAYTGRWFNEVG